MGSAQSESEGIRNGWVGRCGQGGNRIRELDRASETQKAKGESAETGGKRDFPLSERVCDQSFTLDRGGI